MKNKNNKINDLEHKSKSSSVIENKINYNIDNYDITPKIDGFILKRVKPSLITLDD